MIPFLIAMFALAVAVMGGLFAANTRSTTDAARRPSAPWPLSPRRMIRTRTALMTSMITEGHTDESQ